MTLAELDDLLRTLPRRYPALLVDRLLACEPGRSARGVKCVTVGESYFQGHFPDYPVMPGVLMLEALIQLSTLLSCASGQGVPGTVRSLDRVRFKRQVIPGDQLLLETRMEGGGRFSLKASVAGETATEAEVVLVTDAAAAP
ncbi:MAG: 3-hydroxyacyl-ACP dehydratase FabZ [Betaproteobacteria bacterium]|jgi:3-hydroxyacyl-[acyl-carrier-protein] dehydratase|nr:3-hydroxyacyl-ACP dehydratase FabZ [Betaproteobacteria bacterium]MCC7215861.1 3-hydroxyacyl-ACP dehydratase FabZ [Burkholderiales bacterium]